MRTDPKFQTTRDEALPCPFCGEQPWIEPWHGGGPRKRLITCDNDRCDIEPGITGPTKRKALAMWNRRVP